MKVNNVEVPDAGQSTQYITDEIGGWVYAVHTSISVEQIKLSDFEQKLSDAKAQLASAQALVDELQPVADSVASTLEANPALDIPLSVATSTQEK